MNEPNYLESQLRSWTLRRPSDKIASRIFSTEAAPKKSRARFSLNWLAPTTVGLLSLFVICGAHPHLASAPDEADTNLFFASITLDNATSYTSGNSLKTAFNLRKKDMNLEQNVWRTASFESTNLSPSPSSSRSLPVNATNSLMR